MLLQPERLGITLQYVTLRNVAYHAVPVARRRGVLLQPERLVRLGLFCEPPERRLVRRLDPVVMMR